jgi:alpha-glucosidase (family GH31 glycosyl hydrolase)
VNDPAAGGHPAASDPDGETLRAIPAAPPAGAAHIGRAFSRRAFLHGGLAGAAAVGVTALPVTGTRPHVSVLATGAVPASGTAEPNGDTGAGGTGGRALVLPAGGGTVLVVDAAPFRLRLLDTGGAEVVSTPWGTSLNPVSGPEVTGPEPLAPLGAIGAFPALGFVVGAHPGMAFPASYWAGNRLFGASGGAVVPVVGVSDVRRHGDGYRLALRTDVPVGPPARMMVAPLAGGGVRIDVSPPPRLRSAAVVFCLASPPGEGLFGLGGRKDAFDQRGLVRQLWCEEENFGAGDLKPLSRPLLGPTYTFPNGPQAAYFVEAALFGGRGWAAWTGQSALATVDLAATRPDMVRWGTAERELTLFLAGGGLDTAAASFSAVAGRAPAPPPFVYLPWIDVINQQNEGDAAPDGNGFSGGAAVRDRVLEVATMARSLDLPVHVIGIEGWQAVPGIDRLAAALRADGFHLSAYWNPFVGTGNPVYAEAKSLGVLVRDATGEPFPLVDNRGSVSALVDFTNAAAARWWQEQLDRSMALGFEVFMHDYGEQVQQGMVFHDGRRPAGEHNAYPVQYHFAARAAVNAWAAAHPGFEPFFYVRSGFSNLGDSPGVTGATSGVFPGDELTDWGRGDGMASVVPCMLNLALGGLYTFTTDVGGYLDLYTPQTTPELLVRWSQLAALTAVCRIHNSTVHGSVYPWNAGADAVAIYRRYARAKERLAPLVDAWSQRAAATGTVGPVRPLVLDDVTAAGVDDQWMLGTDIVAAPVLQAGATSRSVYLPATGDWQQVRVGDQGQFVAFGGPRHGGQRIEAPAPLTDMPIFVRHRAETGTVQH